MLVTKEWYIFKRGASFSKPRLILSTNCFWEAHVSNIFSTLHGAYCRRNVKHIFYLESQTERKTTTESLGLQVLLQLLSIFLVIDLQHFSKIHLHSFTLGTFLYFYPLLHYLGVISKLFERLKRTIQPIAKHWSNTQTKRTRNRIKKIDTSTCVCLWCVVFFKIIIVFCYNLDFCVAVDRYVCNQIKYYYKIKVLRSLRYRKCRRLFM